MHAAVAAFATARPASPFQQQPRGRMSTGPNRDTTDDPPFRTPAEPVNTPMGVGKGIHPGRVAWAHEPKAATWDGKTGNWWEDTTPTRTW